MYITQDHELWDIPIYFHHLLASTFTGSKNKTKTLQPPLCLLGDCLTPGSFVLRGEEAHLFSQYRICPHIMTSSLWAMWSRYSILVVFQCCRVQPCPPDLSWQWDTLKLHFSELFSTSCSLPPQTCLNWLGYSITMFYFPLALAPILCHQMHLHATTQERTAGGARKIQILQLDKRVKDKSYYYFSKG